MKRLGLPLTKLALSALSLSIALAGCAVGPNYVAPKNALAPFHNATLVGPSQNAPTLDQWWTGFNDPMLVTVVQRALAQNLDLNAAIARVHQARAVSAAAGAALLPTVDLDASATRTHQSLNSPDGALLSEEPGYTRNFDEYTVGPSASWELDLFGGLRRGRSAARDEFQAAEADQAGTRISVAADAADAYLQIRSYQARLAVAQNQIDTDQHLLNLVHDRYNAGAATGREIAQAEALLTQAQASIPPLRVGLEQQLNRLDVLMGAQPGTYARDLDVVQDIPAVPAIPDDRTPTDMLRRRPDIIAAERRLAASNERIGVAISDYYPKISLTSALSFDSLSTGNLISSASRQSAVGGALRWRLFDFGKVKAEVAQAKGENAEALATYQNTVLHAAEDVENALILFSQTQVQEQKLKEQVDALTRARDLSEQAYKAGSITLTDVLDADRELLVARDQPDASRADAARSAVGVYRAFGGGWSVEGTGRQLAANDRATGLSGH
jgi:NodT family efflux transporter outer membrane factor (OMF) lipoprotein